MAETPDDDDACARTARTVVDAVLAEDSLPWPSPWPSPSARDAADGATILPWRPAADVWRGHVSSTVAQPRSASLYSGTVWTARVSHGSSPRPAAKAWAARPPQQQQRGMAATLAQRFAAASSAVAHGAPGGASNILKLQFYAAYKQAVVGDAPVRDLSGMCDVVGKEKHKVWAALRGVPKEAAMQSYVDMFVHNGGTL